MAYNIILQAMSTLRIIKTEEKKPYIKSSYFSAPGKLIGKYRYYSQLEPVSVMLIKQGIVPDMILSLCTEDTIDENKREKFFLEEDMEYEYDMTSYEFYKNRVNQSLPEGASTEFVPVNIDQRNINAGIVEAADQILAVKERLKKENASDKSVKVWVNTQGGFRDTSLVLNAIINLMSAYDIEIADIYSMLFGTSEEGGTPIESKLQNYQIFDFVVGMKEFLNYGRADTLEKYYQKATNNDSGRHNQEAELITTMKKVADAIQMCDPSGFDEGLAELREKINSYEESGTQFFDIFIEKVQEEYGILLSENYTTLDVAKWFRKKEFYQQALTYIEAFVPTEIVNKGIVNWQYDNKKVKAIKKLRNQNYVEDANFLMFTLFAYGKLEHDDKQKGDAGDGTTKSNAKTNTAGDSIETRNKNKNIIKKALKRNIARKEFDIFKNEKTATIYLTSQMINMGAKDIQKLVDFMEVYYELKWLRNQFNHMSNKEKRISKGQLSSIIQQFENLGKILYKSYE